MGGWCGDMVDGNKLKALFLLCSGVWEKMWVYLLCLRRADLCYDGWNRDEQFMRDLVVGLKAKDGARLEPWRCEREYCERYHEHDEWAPRTGKAPCRDYV